MNAKPGEFKSIFECFRFTAKAGPAAFYKVNKRVLDVVSIRVEPAIAQSRYPILVGGHDGLIDGYVGFHCRAL